MRDFPQEPAPPLLLPPLPLLQVLRIAFYSCGFPGEHHLQKHPSAGGSLASPSRF